MEDKGARRGGAGTGAEDVDYLYRGNRLGLPEKGSGSIPGVGRRLVALILDWILALAIVRLLFDLDQADQANVTLLVFALLTVVLLTLFGSTVGKRIVGIRVAATGERSLPWPVAMLARTLLLCLVIPAVVYDRDQRGLHDRVAGTVSLRF
ncbi:RDD family protein [Marinactinospora thermotolerans]|uniref:RDD family protein n=1 Tax=Marinactinospora thermotolerans DSM 45154 TaxID=1122192 RepID=A0A1T4MBN3_9ACTN|nr:RDD family protein [Marinactinospora thermotolerans]SJZ64403.1 RDD family protein [Marinactinospora thermotolerans DSM 45154]